MAEAAAGQTRAETVRNERRRQPGSVVNSGMKLSVDESKLDRKTYEYRFVNDREGRIQRLEAQDWDIVTAAAKPDGSGLGTVQQAHAGVADGKPYATVLMRKRKDWHQADQKEKSKVLDEFDAAIRRGKSHEKQEPGLTGSDVYTPNGVNIIER